MDNLSFPTKITVVKIAGAIFVRVPKPLLDYQVFLCVLSIFKVAYQLLPGRIQFFIGTGYPFAAAFPETRIRPIRFVHAFVVKAIRRSLRDRKNQQHGDKQVKKQ